MIQTFSPKQKQVLGWWRKGAFSEGLDAIICDGAVRSGKTLCLGLSFFLWAMARFQRQQFALCGKTKESIRRNLLFGVRPLLEELGFDWEEKVSRNWIKVRLGGMENTFYLFGGKDEGSASLIQGITLAGVLLDEVALMPRSFVEQACARCSVTGARFWFSCNPEGPGHWFYKEWICKAEDRRALHLRFFMEDNPALPARIRSRYHKAYSGVFYRRFVLGEWTAAQGLVYDFFDRERDTVPAPEDGFDCWRISVDYGTANPASFGLWGRRDGVWYRVEETYFDSRREGRQKTDAEYAEDLKNLAAGRHIQRVIVDPSAASFIETLRREGFTVVKAVNDVADGIRVTADLLKQRKIVLCRACTDCLREMEQYCWDERGGKDAPRKEHDHAMDEMRYFAMDLTRHQEEVFAATWVERTS